MYKTISECNHALTIYPDPKNDEHGMVNDEAGTKVAKRWDRSTSYVKVGFWLMLPHISLVMNPFIWGYVLINFTHLDELGSYMESINKAYKIAKNWAKCLSKIFNKITGYVIKYSW